MTYKHAERRDRRPHREMSVHSAALQPEVDNHMLKCCFHVRRGIGRQAVRPHCEIRNLQYGCLLWTMSLLTEALAGGAGLVHSGMSSEENFSSHSGLKPCPTSCSHPHFGWDVFLLLSLLFVLFSDEVSRKFENHETTYYRVVHSILQVRLEFSFQIPGFSHLCLGVFSLFVKDLIVSSCLHSSMVH